MRLEAEELTGLVARRLEETKRAPLVALAPRFALFLDLVLEANRAVNVVSRASSGPEELVNRHLLDSLEALPYVAAGAHRLLDIGSGAGFPAIPLLIARPDLQGVLVESVGKKCRVLERAIEELDLTARVANVRFPAPQMKGQVFQLLTSRAVADAGGLVRCARPFLAAGARAILWTTELLVPEIRKRSGIQSLHFHRTPDAQVRGLAVLECST